MKNSRQRRTHIETMESRQLMASGLDVSFANGVLSIDGTSDADAITVRETKGRIAIDGHSTTYKATSVGRIDISSFGGNDQISFVNVNRNSRIWSGSGHDTIVTGSGRDSVVAGSGNDKIWTMDGNDSIWGEDGNDQIVAGDDADSIVGGEGADKIWGGDGADEIWGEAGADEIAGGSGNDSIQGGSGADVIWGEAGADSIWGQAGKDTLYGGSGNDRLMGGDNNDLLSGDGGNDRLWGEAGNDQLEGDSGNDELMGGSGNDTLKGGSGSNTLWGEAGSDVCVKDGGRDTMYGVERVRLTVARPSTGFSLQAYDPSITVIEVIVHGATEGEKGSSTMTGGGLYIDEFGNLWLYNSATGSFEMQGNLEVSFEELWAATTGFNCMGTNVELDDSVMTYMGTTQVGVVALDVSA